MSVDKKVELHFRASYGKILASLISMFGSEYIDLIEDAVQNSFYKALKSWKPNRIPNDVDSWLFVAAKYDYINQLKRKHKIVLRKEYKEIPGTSIIDAHDVDPRLKSLFICARLKQLKKINKLAQVIFTLKNVCGFSVGEISACLLMKADAVYKNHQRSKAILRGYSKTFINDIFQGEEGDYLTSVEEILYALFNAGFDVNHKNVLTPMDREVCLDALSLTKLVHKQFKRVSTSNLLALFCFHLARTSARFKDNKIIPFFEQDSSSWDKDLLDLGIHFMQKPEVLDRYYMEALIICKHMMTPSFDLGHWESILDCYGILLRLNDSPIIRMNRAYCLYRSNKKKEALSELEALFFIIPDDNIYYPLIMGEVLKEDNPEVAKKWLNLALQGAEQTFRREHIRKLMEE